MSPSNLLSEQNDLLVLLLALIVLFILLTSKFVPQLSQRLYLLLERIDLLNFTAAWRHFLDRTVEVQAIALYLHRGRSPSGDEGRRPVSGGRCGGPRGR
jgi:hypothetical protein